MKRYDFWNDPEDVYPIWKLPGPKHADNCKHCRRLDKEMAKSQSQSLYERLKTVWRKRRAKP